MVVHSEFELVVGLEVHIQLNTKTKLFSDDSTVFGSKPNTQTNEVSLAHPGTLPVLNKEAVRKAIMLGLACNSEISREFYFDRKHYFYPDSPYGYQITQQNTPICVGGHVSIPCSEGEKEIPLEKIHMEADAGKSIHDLYENHSAVDLNRAGMPLLELVTKPALFDINDVGRFVLEIQKIVRFLGIGDGNMEEGSLRCDANISVKREGEKQLGQKVEIKNMNSVRFIKKALEFEFNRQTKMIEDGKQVLQESRLYNVDSGTTESMREKEEAHDYRYFPDPDLAPVQLSEEDLSSIKSKMPTLPVEHRIRFIDSYGLNLEDALSLSENRFIAELLVSTVESGAPAIKTSNWMLGPFKGLYNQLNQGECKIEGRELADLINLVEDRKITYRNAVEQVLPVIIKGETTTHDVVVSLGLEVHDDQAELDGVIKDILGTHPKEVEAYKNGKKALLQMFMGKVMKATHGKADPKTIMKLIKDRLG